MNIGEFLIFFNGLFLLNISAFLLIKTVKIIIENDCNYYCRYYFIFNRILLKIWTKFKFII
jgi:hypothetical protein